MVFDRKGDIACNLAGEGYHSHNKERISVITIEIDFWVLDKEVIFEFRSTASRFAEGASESPRWRG